jgi:hypothetical protein
MNTSSTEDGRLSQVRVALNRRYTFKLHILLKSSAVISTLIAIFQLSDLPYSLGKLLPKN